MTFVSFNAFHEHCYNTIQFRNRFEPIMRSHFVLSPRATAACAVAGATAVLSGHSAGGTLIAADYATNATYLSGWSTNQNGGYGFGPWSFDGTTANPAGQYQGISTSAPIGTSWTLLTHAIHSGIANAGRAISEPGGLQPGQTLEMVVENPVGYYFYRGWDITCFNGTNNIPGGINDAALRTQVFAYFVTTWDIVDNDGDTETPIDLSTSAVAGMKFDLTLLSTTNYSLTLTPLSNPSAAYSQTGTLVTTNLPINWIDFRLYWSASTGLNDPTNNFEISSMTISGLTLNIQIAGSNAVLSWPTNAIGFNLASSSNLGTGASWSTNFPPPVIVNGQNVVSNPITNTKQFYRLQQ